MLAAATRRPHRSMSSSRAASISRSTISPSSDVFFIQGPRHGTWRLWGDLFGRAPDDLSEELGISGPFGSEHQDRAVEAQIATPAGVRISRCEQQADEAGDRGFPG